jgi:hypothetical protein
MYLRLNNEQIRNGVEYVMSENHIMMNRKKVKANRSVRDLMKEYFRDEETAQKYDNGVRNIDVDKTKDNVVLVKPSDDFDKVRRERLELMSNRRRENGQRAMRKDTVDALTTVVQPGQEFINKMTRDEQIQFFKDVKEVMEDDPDTYGKIDAAVIHFDETTPHMQVLTSTLDFENNRSNAKRMIGNKTKMSIDQTNFVKSVQAKGYDVERGINRLDNNYKEQKEQLEDKYKVQINRHNEHLINELEERETQIDMAKSQTKDEVIEDLATFYPSVKFRYNTETNKGGVVDSNSKSYNEDRYHHFDEDISKNVLSQLDIERLLKIKELARDKQMGIDEEERERKESELKQRENELDERDESLNNRERNLNSRESEIKGREDVISQREMILTDRERSFDDKVDKLNNMYKYATYYAFCEDVKNRYFKAIDKPGEEERRYENFKTKSTYSWEKESGMKNQAKKLLSKESETIVTQPAIEKEQKGFERE